MGRREGNKLKPKGVRENEAVGEGGGGDEHGKMKSLRLGGGDETSDGTDGYYPSNRLNTCIHTHTLAV